MAKAKKKSKKSPGGSADSAVLKRLKKMKEAWDTTAEAGGQVPDGTYVMRLQGAEVVPSQASGKLQIHREHLIRGGDSDGQVMHDYLQLEAGDTSLGFIHRWITMMGMEIPEDPADLPELLEGMVEEAPTYRAKVVSSGDFRNIRVIKLLDSEDEEEEESEEDESEDEDEEEEEKPRGRKSKAKKVEDEDEDEEEEEEEGEESEDEEEGEDESEEDESEEEEEEEGEGEESEDEEEEEGETPKKKKKGNSKKNADREEIAEFMTAYGVEFDEDDDDAALIEKLREFKWTSDKLESSEVKLFRKWEEKYGVSLLHAEKKEKKSKKSQVEKKGKKKSKK